MYAFVHIYIRITDMIDNNHIDNNDNQNGNLL